MTNINVLLLLSPWLISGFILGGVHSIGLDKCIMTYIYHFGTTQSIFIALKMFCALPIHSLPIPLKILAITDLFTVSKVLLFPECHIVGIIKYIAFSKAMRNAGLEEAQAGIKIAGRNINNLRYADDTTLMAESEEELKCLLMKVKEESEA